MGPLSLAPAGKPSGPPMLLQMTSFCSFFMADYFPLCACVCIIICPNVLTHSSFDGRLGCLRVLAIVNNSEVNIPRQISIFLFFSADNPRGIAGSIFHFLRKLHMFSTVAAPIYIPTKGAQGFLFLRILVNTCRFLLF